MCRVDSNGKMKMMKTRTVIFLVVVSIVLTGLLLKAHSSQDIQSSHIDANVPDEKEFDSILKRDLAKYFSDSEKGKIEVNYELLRKGPTQTGVAYPKFYLWVRVNKDGKVSKEGAVRVAAIEKKEFQITDYLSKEEISETPMRVYQIFPQALCERIIEKAKGR
jgi:hypothetical protein